MIRIETHPTLFVVDRGDWIFPREMYIAEQGAK